MHKQICKGNWIAFIIYERIELPFQIILVVKTICSDFTLVQRNVLPVFRSQGKIWACQRKVYLLYFLFEVMAKKIHL